jgi:outer membrane protein assembly factor BamB
MRGPAPGWIGLIAAVVSIGSASSQQSSSSPSPGWPQWGGPDRNFVSSAKGLAASWPIEGPRKLWSRPLGEGHSAISGDGTRVYTLYRPLIQGVHADQEVVAALDAKTGAIAWEYTFASPMKSTKFGEYVGPHSTPLVTANRVYAAGSRKEVLALNKADGQLLWSHDLIREYGAPEGDRGYAASPLLYKDLLIVSVGGAGQALAAFNAGNGALAWKSGDVDQAPGSPILIDIDGQAQIVYFGGDAIAGFDPATGRQLWSHPHRTSASLNISTPVWMPSEKLLFISSAYGHGSRMLELRRAGDKTTVTERWFNNRIRIHFGNAIRIGDNVIASNGDFGPVSLTAVDIGSGNIAWQDRSFARAQLVYADGKLLILDEDGHLGLVSVGPRGLQILGKAQILESVAWTPPSLIDTTLFVRDRRTIAAYSLAK